MTRALRLLGLAAVLAAGADDARAAGPSKAQLTNVARLLEQWQVTEAAQALEPLLRSSPTHPRVAELHGEVLLHQGRYAEAETALGEASRRGRPAPTLIALRALARSTASTVKGYVRRRSPGGHFEIWTSKGKDEILSTFAGEALDAIRAALAQDLGYSPRDAIRVEIYPTPEDLTRVSPLTLSDLERSGTIALCKYNRLMLVSPRALPRGYPWLDTLAHEYTHLVLARVSRNTLPIWLQEGLAKFFEARWRLGPGQSAPLPPALEHALAQALRAGKLIRWEQMHPSMAKLPSQDATALAFAQVQTAVTFLVQSIQLEGLRRMIRTIALGRPAWDALEQASGLDQTRFERAWKQHLRAANLRLLGDLVPPRLRFGKAPSKEQELAQVKQTRARRYMRLAELLRSRTLTRAAIVEYEKARRLLGPRDDLTAHHLARAYLEVSSPAEAINVLLPVLEYYPDLPGPQVTLGIAYLRNGEPALAERHLKVALRIHPFNPEIHCGLASALERRAPAEGKRHGALCGQLQ